MLVQDLPRAAAASGGQTGRRSELDDQISQKRAVMRTKTKKGKLGARAQPDVEKILRGWTGRRGILAVKHSAVGTSRAGAIVLEEACGRGSWHVSESAAPTTR